MPKPLNKDIMDAWKGVTLKRKEPFEKSRVSYTEPIYGLKFTVLIRLNYWYLAANSSNARFKKAGGAN